MTEATIAVLRDRIKDRRARIERLQGQLDALIKPVVTAAEGMTRAEAEAQRTALAAYKDDRTRLETGINQAENDIEAAENRIGSLEETGLTRQREEGAATRAEEAAGRAERGQRGRESREFALEQARIRQERAKQRQAERNEARAGQVAWGPDGIPYGRYMPDGRIQIFAKAERDIHIRMARAGLIRPPAVGQAGVGPGPAAPGEQAPRTPVEPEADIGRAAGEAPRGWATPPEPEAEPAGLNVGDFPADITGGTGGRGRSAALEALTEAQTRLTEVKIKKAERDLLGIATIAAQNHVELVNQLHQEMLRPGTDLTEERATSIIRQSQRNLEAVARGTTVALEDEKRRAEVRARREEGVQLVNQRLQSGASLAAALTHAAFGSGVMTAPGETTLGIGYSPSMLALEMSQELQGGPQTTALARALLGTRGPPEDEDWLMPPKLAGTGGAVSGP